MLGRIVDIGAELFAISSAIVYAQTIAKEQPQRADAAFELADLFSKQARSRADDLFSELFSNEDDANYKLAGQVLEGRYEFLEEGIVDPAELGAEGGGPQIAGQEANGKPAGKEDAAKATGETPVAARVQ